MKFGNGNFLTRLLFLVGACWLLLAALVPRSASAAASLEVEKYANVDCAMVGDTIYYTINVDNDGSVKLTNIVVNDSLLGNVTKKIFGTTTGTLDAYTNAVYTFSYKVKATNPDPLLNTVTVTAKAQGSGKTLTAKATTTVDIIHPAIEVTKTADREYATYGDTIFYTITVKNTGDDELDDLYVYDNLLGDLSEYFVPFMPKGTTQTQTFIYCVSPGDPNPLENEVYVEAYPDCLPTVCVSDTADASVIITPIGISKVGDRIVAQPGDVITYSITITNNGTKKLKNIKVVDSLLGDVSASFPDELAAGDSDTEDFTYTVKATDPNPLVNYATVTATVGTTSNIVKNKTFNEIEVVYPGLLVTKTADKTSAAVGDTITYTITLKNTGKEPLKIKSVDDTILGDLSDEFPGNLPVGATISNTFDYEVLAGDPNPLVNTVTVTAKVEDLPSLITEEASASVAIGETPASIGIAVDKVADKVTASTGDTINYTITISNPGDVDLTNVTVTDSLLGTLSFPSTLDAGDTLSDTFPYVVKATDSGTLVNTVTATGTPVTGGEPVSSSASVSVTIVKGASSIAVLKVADRGSANVGKQVKYSITVTNTGSTILTNVTVIDTLLGNLSSYFGGTLNPGASVTKVFPYTVKSTDPNPLLNTVTVTGTPVGTTTTVTASDTASVPRCSAGGGSEPGQQDHPDMMIYNASYKNIKGANIYNTTGIGQEQYQSVAKGCAITYILRVENDTLFPAEIRIKGEGSNNGWKVQYFDARNGGKDITAQVTGDGWNPSCDCTTLAANGGARDFIVVITPTSSTITSGTVKDIDITAYLVGSTDADVVKAITTVL